MNKNIISVVLISLVSFFLGVISHSLIKADEKITIPHLQETRESGYNLINPLLECEPIDNMGNAELKNLKNKLGKNYTKISRNQSQFILSRS